VAKGYVLQQKYELACYSNTLVQLLALYTDPESHNAQRYRDRQARPDRQTTMDFVVKRVSE